MTKLKTIRKRIYDARTRPLGGKWIEVIGGIPIRKKHPKPAAPLPDGSRVIVSENGDFIFQDGDKFWTCPLSPDERKLMKEVGHCGGELYGDAAYELLWPGGAMDEGKKLRDVVSHINQKLSRRELPVQVSFRDWKIGIRTNPRI